MKRKILRNRARLNMKREGIQRPNKRPWVKNLRNGLMERADSFFSQHWREYAAVMPLNITGLSKATRGAKHKEAQNG